MMSPRERMERTFTFQNPDKIPLYYHPSTAGLHVHGEKLLELFNRYPPDNPIQFSTVPHPPADAYNENGEYHQIMTDAWKTDIAYSIFGIAGIPVSHPFASWEEAEEYTFPDYQTDSAEIKRQKENYLVFKGTVSIFERVHTVQPFEKVLIDTVTKAPGLLRFLDRLVDYWAKGINYFLECGTDVIMVGDDWGTQNSLLISPELFREVFKPRYRELFRPIKAAGKRVFFHSCGLISEILDDLIELGIDGLWPQINFFETDPTLFKQCEEARVTLFIHPERQKLIPKGTPQQIEDQIARYADKFHRLGGGGIFYVEIENDAPFENVERLITSIDKFR